MSVPKVSKMQQRLNMTQEERDESDALKSKMPENTFWDDARKMYETSIIGLEQTHGLLVAHIQAIMANPEERSKIQDTALLTANINILIKDIETHVNLLNDIYSTHSDKTGGTTTADEAVEVIQVNGRYHDAIELYNTVIMPTVAHIFEQINVSDDLIAQAVKESVEKQLTEEQDPNIVTDVQVKESN